MTSIKTPNINFSMPEFVEYIKNLEKEVSLVQRYRIDNGKLVDQKNKLNIENDTLREANDVLIDNIAIIKKERNVARRQVNRLEYNITKMVAIGLTEGEYFNLTELDRHYWREYADIVLRAKVGRGA